MIKLESDEWIHFIDWISRHYGTPRVGLIVFPLSFSTREATNAVEAILDQKPSLKDVLGALAISQMTKTYVPSLSLKARDLSKKEGLGLYALRVVSVWAAMMQPDDHEFHKFLAMQIISALSRKSDYINAAYLLELLNGEKAIRYQLVQAAIKASSAIGLDSQVSDIFHVYCLRYFHADQLNELRLLAYQQQQSSDNPFVDSLIQCIDAWLYINAASADTATSHTFSEYLSNLAVQLYAAEELGRDGLDVSPMSSCLDDILTMRKMTEGRYVPMADVGEPLIARLFAETSKLAMK